jgi:hypothetical protein
LSEKYPDEFGTRQHSIVQRLLRAHRRLPSTPRSQRLGPTDRPKVRSPSSSSSSVKCTGAPSSTCCRLA